MKSQIYSMQSIEDAKICLEAGADRIGVLASERCGEFPCEVKEKDAYEIFRLLDGKCTSILISVGRNEEEIFHQLEYLRPNVLHLCANYTGSPSFREHMREKFPDIELMEAVGITTREESIKEALRVAEYADYLLLDSVSATVKGIGAAGITHDWSIDKEIIDLVSIPVIVAGGLGPENVKEAMDELHPWGVDSLTKTSILKDGKIVAKDKEKVNEFCRIVKEEAL